MSKVIFANGSLVEGRIIHFVLHTEFKTLDEHGSLGKIVCRPAIIVNAWSGKYTDGKINIQVFLDGVNDYRLAERECFVESQVTQSIFKYASKLLNVKSSSLILSEELGLPLTIWLTSVKYSESKKIGTWHWPERN